MEGQPGKENFIHRILRTKPWAYALLLLAVLLILCAVVFDKIAMPIVARSYVEEKTVPALEGLDSLTAVQKATEAGFNVLFAKEREYSKTYDVDLVMRQNPLADQKSNPDLFDKNGSEAVVAIEKAGLNMGLTFSMPHTNVKKGKVVRTNPSEGSLVHKGDTVDVFLSSGPNGAKVELPEVVGSRLTEALSNLRSAGFIIGKTERRKNSGEQSGRVLKQDPAAGSVLSAGSRVNLVVAE